MIAPAPRATPAPALAPQEALARLAGEERPFLLDSGSNADGCGAYSYAGCDPVAVLEWRLGDLGDPFERLERMEIPCLAVGFLGYELGSIALPSVRLRPQAGRLPALVFAAYDAVWRLDCTTGQAEVLGPGAPRLRALLERPAPPLASFAAGPLVAATDEQAYAARFARLLEYIRAGDVYQANLTHPLRTPFSGSPLAAFLALRRRAAPFSAYLGCGDGRALLANSPERFLRGDGWRVESRPIKGTREKGPGRAAELAADDKERAEHVMIVDLMRSDLGRVCETGSIVAQPHGRVVEYPTLYHLVSTVSGRARPGLGLGDLLRATFPGGSVTGAPKVRAMQVIAELEPWARGPYTGAFGRIGPVPVGGGSATRAGSFDFDFAMTIRTAVCTPGELELGVGGGIVADSVVEREWEETRLKARAFVAALGENKEQGTGNSNCE